MKVIKSINNIRHCAKAAIVTIGVFDGVHIGHRAIIKETVKRARKMSMKSLVITFDPHPLKILCPYSSAPSLISLEHRIKLIEALGVDCLMVLEFTRFISALPARTFVKSVLANRVQAKEVFVGEDFYFGHGAKAGVRDLVKLGREFDFKVKVVKPVRISGVTVSSSLIRRFITEGRLSEASKFLGRPVSVLGTVVAGLGIAKDLGFPTANVNPHHEVIPPAGVYAVIAQLQDRFLKGVLNIGVKPTFYGSCDKEPTIEVHLFNFNKKIYGKDIEIFFIKKLRDERRFPDRNLLAAQIQRDAQKAYAVLRRF